jgi:hypothetical protein
MSSAPLASARAIHDKVAQAASVVARAFDDDPLNVAMFPGVTAVATWQGPDATSETTGQLAQAGFDELPDGVPLKSFDAVFGAIGAPGPSFVVRRRGLGRPETKECRANERDGREAGYGEGCHPRPEPELEHRHLVTDASLEAAQRATLCDHKGDAFSY